MPVPSKGSIKHASPSTVPDDLSAIPLIDYICQDARPVFVVELLEDPRLPDPVPSLTLCNHSLTSIPGLSQHITRAIDPANRTHTLNPPERVFRSWMESEIRYFHGVSREQFAEFYGYWWTSTKVAQKYIVCNGVKSPLTELPRSKLRSKNRLSADIGNFEISEAPSNAIVPASTASTDPSIGLGGLSGADDSNVSDHITFLRQFDWASTPIGSIETWPLQLRQTVDLMIANPDPTVVFWGKRNTMIYNEPYLVIAGKKHPKLLGGELAVEFEEVWDQFAPIFRKMRSDGQAIKQENVSLLLNRHGQLEEGFFTFTLVPLIGEDGTVVGVYETVFELTKQTLSERRMRLLLDVGKATLPAVSVNHLWAPLLESLESSDGDLPSAVLYRVDETEEAMPIGSPDFTTSQRRTSYVLEGAIGHARKEPFSRERWCLEDDGDEFTQAFRDASTKRGPSVLPVEGNPSIGELSSLFSNFACANIVICPLSPSLSHEPRAFLVVGASASRPCDDDYHLFLELLSRQVERSVASIKLFEEEKGRLAERAAHEQKTLSLQLELRTREAEESEMRFKRFVESSPVGVFLFDVDGSIKFCNEAWFELTGHPKGLVTPMSWTQVVHPDDLKACKKAWDALAALEGPQTFECRLSRTWRPSGEAADAESDFIWVLVSAYPEVSDEGVLIDITGLMTDISHQKWAERVQSQRLSEALELKRQQENFMDMTSHEIRNPLNAILHCATELVDVLKRLHDMLDPKFSSFMEDCLSASNTIIYCGHHQKRIVDDVLTLSKLDSDLLSIHPLAIGPSTIVEEVLRIFESELRTSNVQASLVLADSYLDHNIDLLFLDSHRVIQILINLTANALKFTKSEPTRRLDIVLNASKNKPSDEAERVRYVPTGRLRKHPFRQAEWRDTETVYLRFSVRDTGPGMTTRESELLFNRFAQVSPRTHSNYGSSGLGLFISRELAELHGGAIGMSSQVGVGSVFDFYIETRRPAAQVQVIPQITEPHLQNMSRPRISERKASETGNRRSSSRRGNIVVVEDNLVNQNILVKLLRKQGYTVTVANDGEEALAIIQSSRWSRNNHDSGIMLDVVVSDIEMPRMDGKTLVRKIRELQRDRQLAASIPVIAVTGNARPEQMTEAKACGFDDVVSKPYNPYDLFERLDFYTSKSTDSKQT